MTDAQNLFDHKTSYSGEWQIDEYMNSLPRQKRAIIIAVDHGNAERLNELTHYKNEEYGGGKASEFERFLMTEVLPEITAKYDIPLADHPIAVAGSSLGGVFSLQLFLQYPNKFVACAALSPSLWYSDNYFYDLEATSFTRSRFLFMSFGRQEGENHLSEVMEYADIAFAKANLKATLSINDHHHNEAQWVETFREFYVLLLQFLN